MKSLRQRIWRAFRNPFALLVKPKADPEECPCCGKRKPFLGPGHKNRCGAPPPEGFGP